MQSAAVAASGKWQVVYKEVAKQMRNLKTETETETDFDSDFIAEWRATTRMGATSHSSNWHCDGVQGAQKARM